MKKALSGTFWCLATLAAGCESLPRADGVPNPPAASRPEISQMSASQPPVASSPETIAPFDGMAELSVDAVVRQVLERNPSLAQMNAAWQAVSARYPQVTSLDDPMFEAMLAPASIGSNDVEFGGRLAISQKLPWPGKRQARGDAALAEANAAALDVDDMRLQLSESAQHAYYDYYLVDRALEVNQQGLDLLQRSRKDVAALFANPPKDRKVSIQDVIQVDVEIGRQRERGLTLERMRRVAVARINTLMHIPPDAALPPPLKQLTVAGELPDPAALRTPALSRRPDLQALAQRIAADEAALAVAEREHYPDVEVMAAYDTIMGNGPTRDLAPQFGMRVNLPIRKAKRSAAVAEAEARIAQRRAELQKRTDEFNFEVQQAYEQTRESEKVVRLYEQEILQRAQENVDAALPAYRNGLVPVVSLIESRRNFVGLRERYYEALADYFRRRATLERVVGGTITP